jgi:hypothetical protein
MAGAIMIMRVKPKYLVLALVAALGLYLAGVPMGTLILLLAFAYMASMHLGGGHGGGGHGGGGPADDGSGTDPANTAERGGDHAGEAVTDREPGSHH